VSAVPGPAVRARNGGDYDDDDDEDDWDGGASVASVFRYLSKALRSPNDQPSASFGAFQLGSSLPKLRFGLSDLWRLNY